MTPITPEQIDALLPYLELFEDPQFSAGQWEEIAPGHLPMFSFDPSVLQFIQTLYEHGWVAPDFDWGEWQDTAHNYHESRELIESADAVTIQKLLTTHTRADRFCEGHLAAKFSNGHMVSLLRRLREIRTADR